MSNVTEVLSNIREGMQSLEIPENYTAQNWVEARVAQYSKLLEKESITVEHVFVQVNSKNLKDFEPLNSETFTVEEWEDVQEGTYRIEFETTNPSLDTLAGLFQGMYGKKDEVEIAWALWRTDSLNVELATKIATKLV